MKVAPEILQALRDADTDGPRLVLAGPRMDARLYQRINEVLEAVGGRWTRTAEAHLFPVDAAQAIAPVLADGEVVTLREKKQSAQYFPTPAPVVQRLLELADARPGMAVLEPSAGSGAIATALAQAGATVDCIERDPGYAALLTDAAIDRHLTVADFLTVPAEPRYDRVVMNPPFTKGADMQHVQHALRFLKPCGILVAVMSWTVTEHNSRTAGFRTLVEARRGTVEAVPEKAFAESGTNVPTVIVTIPATPCAGAVPTVWPARAVDEKPDLDVGDPREIAADICANLRTALREFEAVAAALESPTAPTRPAEVAEVLELPTVRQEQLAFDVTEAS